MSSYYQRSQQKYQQPSYYSPAQVDSDQKDVIIQQLQQDIGDLKKNQADFPQLTQNYKDLQSRYQLLQMEKEQSETNFRQRYDMDMKQISQLQTEIGDLTGVRKQKELEILSLNGDKQQLERLNAQKNSEAQNLKSEIDRNYELNNNFSLEKRNKDVKLTSLQKEINNLMNELAIIQEDIKQLQLKKNEVEEYFKELNIQKQRLFSQNNQLNSQKLQVQKKISIFQKQFQLQNDLSSKNNRVNYLDSQRQDEQKILEQLNIDFRELQRILDQIKAEAYNNNRLFMEEKQKGQELISRLQFLESSIQQKIAQITELSRDNQMLRSQNSELMDLNSQLNMDLEALKKHIELVTERNSLFLDELDAYEEQDEKLRAILLRKSRVATTKFNADDRMRKILMLIQNE